MGLLVSALLALSAEPSLSVRALHYGRLAAGLSRSWFVREGMTRGEVRRVMGHCHGWYSGTVTRRQNWYEGYGVTVWFTGFPESYVVRVEWQPLPFTPAKVNP